MRSKILIELLNNNVSIETFLFRLKAITKSLNNTLIDEWINSELTGYNRDNLVPEYRKIVLEPRVNGTNGYWKIDDFKAPLNHLEEHERNAICNYLLKDGISIYEKSVTENNNLYMNYNENVCYLLSKGFSSNMHIYSAYSIIPLPALKLIISNVKNKLLDVFLELEQSFGNLDNYDILDNINTEIKEKIANVILNYINIGNGNNIDNSLLGGKFHE